MSKLLKFCACVNDKQIKKKKDKLQNSAPISKLKFVFIFLFLLKYLKLNNLYNIYVTQRDLKMWTRFKQVIYVIQGDLKMWTCFTCSHSKTIHRKKFPQISHVWNVKKICIWPNSMMLLLEKLIFWFVLILRYPQSKFLKVYYDSRQFPFDWHWNHFPPTIFDAFSKE